MYAEWVNNSDFNPGTAENRSLFLSLANQGCTPAIALWEETSMLSSDSCITKGFSRLLQHSQALQHNLSWQEGDLGSTMITVNRSCGKRICQGSRHPSVAHHELGMEALCKPGCCTEKLNFTTVWTCPFVRQHGKNEEVQYFLHEKSILFIGNSFIAFERVMRFVWAFQLEEPKPKLWL